MPRPGYTNVAPSDERANLLTAICGHLALNPREHSARLEAIDYALRIASQLIVTDATRLEWMEYLVGKRKKDQVRLPENRAKLARRQDEERERKLQMLGYNQALLDHIRFPVGGDDAPLTREEVEAVVARLRAELGK
jgi:hypothetical protein